MGIEVNSTFFNPSPGPFSIIPVILEPNAAERFKKVMDGVTDRIALFNPREYEIK